MPLEVPKHKLERSLVRPPLDALVATTEETQRHFPRHRVLRLARARVHVQQPRNDVGLLLALRHEDEQGHDAADLVPEERLAGDRQHAHAGHGGRRFDGDAVDGADEVADAVVDVRLADVAEVVRTHEPLRAELHQLTRAKATN